MQSTPNGVILRFCYSIGSVIIVYLPEVPFLNCRVDNVLDTANILLIEIREDVMVGRSQLTIRQYFAPSC